MEILDDLEIVDVCLYMKYYKTLIVSDIHLGYEESLNKKGYLLPRLQFNDTYEKLKKIISNLDIKKIIIPGDLKHEFGSINETEWRNTLKLIDLFIDNHRELILIKGNHDTILSPIARKRNVTLVDYYVIGDIIICHGNKILNNEDFKKSKTIIIGHEHPAVGLKEKSKYELYKCFLKGKYKNKNLIVLPAFNVLTIGTDILRKNVLSPYLKQDLSNFKVYIVNDYNVYNFGKIKNL